MMMRVLLLLALVPATALADPTVDDIVQRARAVAEKKPQHLTCQMTMETQLFDKSGKVEHRELREGDGKLDGNDAELETRRAWRDGKPVAEADLQKERDKAKERAAKRKNDGDELELAPLAAKNAGGQTFALVGREQLWGHDVYVLKVTATRPSTGLANGTLWVDAASFVELKGELTPAKLPDHADWVRVQEQFALDKGVALPTYLHVVGAGHFLMFKKGFESTMKWRECR